VRLPAARRTDPAREHKQNLGPGVTACVVVSAYESWSQRSFISECSSCLCTRSGNLFLVAKPATRAADLVRQLPPLLGYSLALSGKLPQLGLLRSNSRIPRSHRGWRCTKTRVRTHDDYRGAWISPGLRCCAYAICERCIRVGVLYAAYEFPVQHLTAWRTPVADRRWRRWRMRDGQDSAPTTLAEIPTECHALPRQDVGERKSRHPLGGPRIAPTPRITQPI